MSCQRWPGGVAVRLFHPSHPLAESPGSDAVRNALIELLVVEQDRPAEAAKLLTDAVEETWRVNVRLVVRAEKELSAKQCFQLGQWYLTLAKKAGSVGRLKSLSCAKIYFEAVLSRADSPDLLKAEAKLNAKRTDQAIEASQAGILSMASQPKIVVVPRASFQKLYGATFPGANNVARGGSARVIGAYTGSPKGLLTGKNSCVLKDAKGTFVFRWNPRISGRFLLLTGGSDEDGTGAWDDATMRVTGSVPIPISGFGADKVLIADFGKKRLFSWLRIDVKRGDSPGLAGIAIHASLPSR